MELIRDFKNLSKEDVLIAGGKGASLGEMTRAGIPVPPGFVILSDSFEKFLEETDLNVEIQAALDKVDTEDVNSVEQASEKVKAMILEKKIPKDISKEILDNFNKLGAKFIAVRSSATSEDSASAAWAGQLDSFLNTTEDTLLENVRRCWASLFTPRAIFYRFEQKLDKNKISVAVVVQKMVESEVSGIAFSVHPVTQDKNQIIIEAGYGLGEAIVSGQITPDAYVIDKRNWQIIDKNISEQEKGIYRIEKGGNEWRNISKEHGGKQKLNDKEIIELSKLIVNIENHYGFPCDIEWAREKGKFYILQSRPITTLTENRDNNGTNYKSSDYIRMFETTRMPFLINTIALEHYEPLKAMSILRSNLWTTYLPKESEKKTLQEGIKLFGSESLFKEYQAEFEAYKKRSISFFDSLFKKDKPSKEEIEEYFSLIAELWKYYQKTEFFYVDEAYRKSKDNKLITNNLRKLEEIKNSGREHLNKLIFGSNSYLNKILLTVSKQFGISIEDLMFYSKEEIYNLFDKKKVEERILTQRKEAYVFYSKNNRLEILQGDRALEFIKEFLVEKGVKEIKGTSANKGKVIGRARVLFYGPETFDKIPEIIRNMKQGEILVTETTSPETITACKKASAILTNQGGLLSHAAIVSRELNIPCIVGLGNITHIVKDGDLVEVDADNGIVKILEKADEISGLSKQTIFDKTHTREHSLMYGFVWKESDYKMIEELWHNNVKLIILKPNESNKLEGWYNLKDLEDIYSWVIEQLNTNPDYFKLVKKRFYQYLTPMIPFLEGKAKINNFKELKEYYHNWLHWWSPMDSFLLIPDFEGIPQKIKKEALKIREETHKYTDNLDRPFVEFFTKKFPEYKELVNIILPQEVFILEKTKLSKEEEEKIKQRKKGCVLFPDEVILLKDLKLKLEEAHIKLNRTAEPVTSQIKGNVAYSGKVKGLVRVILYKEDLKNLKDKEIIVTEMTSPEFMPAIKKASAIVTDEGGITCHAAIISRELKKPCIIGTKIATQVLHDGDLVEVDADNGIVKIIKKA